DGSTGWSLIATPTNALYSDTGLSASTAYYYRVEATNTAGNSAPSNVASATTPASISVTQSPQGNWVGTYGANGYGLLGWNASSDLASLSQSTLILDQGARYSWSAATSDVRALQSPDGSARRATCWYDGTQLRFHLAFTASYSGTLHLYALDWDHWGRREAITVNDGSGPRTANLNTDFSQGAWVNVPVTVASGG